MSQKLSADVPEFWPKGRRENFSGYQIFQPSDNYTYVHHGSGLYNSSSERGKYSKGNSVLSPNVPEFVPMGYGGNSLVQPPSNWIDMAYLGEQHVFPFGTYYPPVPPHTIPFQPHLLRENTPKRKENQSEGRKQKTTHTDTKVGQSTESDVSSSNVADTSNQDTTSIAKKKNKRPKRQRNREKVEKEVVKNEYDIALGAGNLEQPVLPMKKDIKEEIVGSEKQNKEPNLAGKLSSAVQLSSWSSILKGSSSRNCEQSSPIKHEVTVSGVDNMNPTQAVQHSRLPLAVLKGNSNPSSSMGIRSQMASNVSLANEAIEKKLYSPHVVLTGVGRGRSVKPGIGVVPQKPHNGDKSNVISEITERSSTPAFDKPNIVSDSRDQGLAKQLYKTNGKVLNGRSHADAISAPLKGKKKDKKENRWESEMERRNRGEIKVEMTVRGMLKESISSNLVQVRKGNKLSSSNRSLIAGQMSDSRSSERQVNQTPIMGRTNSSNSLDWDSDTPLDTDKESQIFVSGNTKGLSNKNIEKDWPDLGSKSAAKSVVLSYSDILRKRPPLTKTNSAGKTATLAEETQNVIPKNEENWEEERRRRKKEKKKAKKKEKKLAIRAEQERLGTLPKPSEAKQKLSQTPVTLDFGSLFDSLVKASGSSLGKAVESSPARTPKKRPILSTGVVSIASGLGKKNLYGTKRDQNKVSLNALDSTQPIKKRGKERENPRRKKLTLLRKIILKEREAKRQAREQKKTAQEHHDANEISNELDIIGNSDTDSSTTLSADAKVEAVEGGSAAVEGGSAAVEGGSAAVGPLNDLPEHIIKKLHSRKFREYCDHFVTRAIGENTAQLLCDLQRFQQRAYQENPVKAKAKRRLVSGLREISRHVKLRRLKCIILAPNLERIASEGGIDDYLFKIIASSKDYNIPIIYAMSRQGLGKILKKKVPVSAVGIFSYDGAQDTFKNLMAMVEEQRKAYRIKVEELLNEPMDSKSNEQNGKGKAKRRQKKKRTSGTRSNTHVVENGLLTVQTISELTVKEDVISEESSGWESGNDP